VIVVHTLDQLGRTVRDTLNLIRELTERCVGVHNLADPTKVDSSNPADPMAQLAVLLLALIWADGTHLPTPQPTRGRRRSLTVARRPHDPGSCRQPNPDCPYTAPNSAGGPILVRDLAYTQ